MKASIDAMQETALAGTQKQWVAGDLSMLDPTHHDTGEHRVLIPAKYLREDAAGACWRDAC